jgi:hypothetical protein
MRLAFLVAALSVVAAGPALAQGEAFGLGARMSMVRADVDADASAERFTGGHIRARISPRSALEVALDMRTQTNEDHTRRIRQYPLQASLLLFPMKTSFAPYVLGGGGWYNERIEQLQDDKAVSSAKTREFGWHGGFGAELRLGRHAGAHADYRYTFLRFGDDETASGGTAAADGDSGFSRFVPSHQGSMWTAGFTLYF